MSRVDEAMRRAAEAAALKGVGGASSEAPHAIGVDAAEFAGESFPIEMPDRRRSRSIVVSPIGREDSESASAALPQAQGVPSSLRDGAPTRGDGAPRAPIDDVTAAANDHRTSSLPPPAPASLFERLDARLAAKVVIDQKMLPASREQYRRLAATLHHRQAATGLKVVMIASAVMGEGKTLTASNLALTLSESYKRTVLLIDADLRRPSLNTVFQMNGAPGLAEGLISPEERKLTLHMVSPRLSILPAGKPSSDPMAGLTSDRMRRVIAEAREAFDWIIVDTPPVGLLTDANLLASMVDGAVLVVHAGSTPCDLVKRAVEAIGVSRMLGVVLNRADAQAHGYGYGYDYYGQGHASPAAPANSPLQ